MRIPRPRPRRPHLPRRTARLRLTVLYGAAFLACGATVLAVVAFLFYPHAALPPPTTSAHVESSATAVSTRKIPIADVRQAGRFDIVTGSFPFPAADVHRAGGSDVLSIAMPGAAFEKTVKAPVLTPAEQAKLVDDAQFHIDYAYTQILIICAIALAVIAVAAAAIGWGIAGRVLRPLSTITATARRIAASSLHERLDLHGPDDELKELGDTLDNLFARLEASFGAQRRFAANASHELRTPLTRERTLLQVTLADPASTVATWQAVSRELLASNAEQERLIEALLTLANSEGDIGEHERLDLAAITSAALAVARPAISQRGLRLQTTIAPAALDGDPLLVQQLVSNLVDNAVRHNVPGGDIQVTTQTSEAGAVLSVTSSGQVIPAAEVDRLFQPFQRFGARPARRDGGHGLGLSIVRAIAAAHAATISARPRPGGGLAIDVTFPAAAAPPSSPPQANRPASLARGGTR